MRRLFVRRADRGRVLAIPQLFQRRLEILDALREFPHDLIEFVDQLVLISCTSFQIYDTFLQ